MRRVIYISGPITGTDDYMERFQAAEDKLTREGHLVFNPAKLCAALPEGADYETFMRVAFFNLSFTNTIYMMRGWENSKGARREHIAATMDGKEVWYEDPTQPEDCRFFHGWPCCYPIEHCGECPAYPQPEFTDWHFDKFRCVDTDPAKKSVTPVTPKKA